MIESKTEGERELVEYVDSRGRKKYTDAEDFVEDDKDFSDRISEENLPQGMEKNQDKIPDKVLEKVSGLNGFRKLEKADKEDYLKQKIPDFVEE